MYTLADWLYTLKLKSIADNLLLYVTIATFAIGLTGNSISIKIYLSKKFKKTTCWIYFIAYSIIETLFLASNVVYVIQPMLWQPNDAYCKSFLYLNSVLQHTCPWILVLNSLDRIAMVIFPHRFKFTRKKPFVIAAISFIVIMYLLFFIPQIFSVESAIISQLDKKYICVASIAQSYLIYSLVSICLYTFLPFFIVLVSTILIISKLHRKANAIHKNGRGKNQDYQFGRTIIGTNACFMVIQIPYCIAAMLVTYYRTFDFVTSVLYNGHLLLGFNTSASLLLVYHAISFFIHIICNKIYRSVVVDFLRKLFSIKQNKTSSNQRQ